MIEQKIVLLFPFATIVARCLLDRIFALVLAAEFSGNHEEHIMKIFYYLLSDEVGARMQYPRTRTWTVLEVNEPDTQVIPPPGLATWAESPTQSSLCYSKPEYGSNHLAPISPRIALVESNHLPGL